MSAGSAAGTRATCSSSSWSSESPRRPRPVTLHAPQGASESSRRTDHRLAAESIPGPRLHRSCKGKMPPLNCRTRFRTPLCCCLCQRRRFQVRSLGAVERTIPGSIVYSKTIVYEACCCVDGAVHACDSVPDTRSNDRTRSDTTGRFHPDQNWGGCDRGGYTGAAHVAFALFGGGAQRYGRQKRTAYGDWYKTTTGKRIKNHSASEFSADFALVCITEVIIWRPAPEFRKKPNRNLKPTPCRWKRGFGNERTKFICSAAGRMDQTLMIG